MGQHSTDVAYGFGQVGSTFLKGDGAKLLLTASTAKYYVCAISMVTDGGDATLTPATLAGGSTIVFNDVGDSVILIYNTTGGWAVLSNNGTTVS